MDYIKAEQIGADTVVSGASHFCLDDILECGQCFRWDKLSDGVFRGIAFGLCRTISQSGDTIRFHSVTLDEFDRLWYNYFDFGRDYSEVKRILSSDEPMRRAMAFTPGMRVLRQEPWETLCSFILSQNNNIKRIRGLVARLCESFGEPIDGGFAFPAAERLSSLEAGDLAPVRCGFRAAYIIDAAKRVSSGELDFERLSSLPSNEAGAELQKIHGVGPKVASCVLLYGLGRADSVPVDVWMGRAQKTFYPQGMPAGLTSVAGLGQQYLFHYIRNCKEALAL